MIRIEMLRRGAETCGFTVSGHAGYAEEGSDIVCSAVSALTIATANGLESIARVPVTVTDNGKELTCILRECSESQRHDASILLDSMEAALADIRRNYKQYLKISDREV